MLIEKHKVIWLCADELSSSWIPSYVLKEDEEIVKYPYLLLHEEMRIVVFNGGGGSELRNQIHYECWMAIEVIFWSVNKSKNKGLISADRRTKPTLMLTIPRSIFKSSTKDLSLPTFEIAMEYDARPKPIVMRVTSGEVNIVAFQHGFWLRGVQS